MEAHAEDTWPLGLDRSYNQTHTIEARAKVARDFIEDNSYQYAIRIDEAPSNSFNATFAAWPLRFFVIEPDDGKLVYIHEPDGPFILVESLHRWLGEYLSV